MSRLAAFLSQATQEYRQMRLGLHRIEAALKRLGHPEKSFASVLIAGTNGKGSTARMVESVLRQAGHRTGLYTSPHLLRFNERILLCGEEVSDAMLESILDEWTEAGILDAAGNWSLTEEKLTWFEKATVLAFEVFRRSQVEIAVLEVGLGGRLDATNTVEPLASAVTSIGMDHAEVLGPTLRDIAREKAGVMRRGRTLVLGPVDPELAHSFRQWAVEGGARLMEVRDLSEDRRGLPLPLEGRHQRANAAVALELLAALATAGFSWTEKDLGAGLASVKHPGRLQWLPGRPQVLLDGAHNPPALSALADYLLEKRAGQPLVFVMAMLREKDPAAALDILGTVASDFVFTEIQNPRCLPLEAWRELVKKHSIHADFLPDPQAALDLARERAGPEGWVVVAGSLYLVAEVLTILSSKGLTAPFPIGKKERGR